MVFLFSMNQVGASWDDIGSPLTLSEAPIWLSHMGHSCRHQGLNCYVDWWI